MDTSNDCELPLNRRCIPGSGGNYKLGAWLAGFCCLWVSLIGGGMATPVAANTAVISTDGATTEQAPLEQSAPECGNLPRDAYSDQNSVFLNRTFCELLAFSPFSLSSADSFFNQIKPGSYVSDREPSAEAMTLPSLWWSRDSLPRQFGSYRLVESWAAYEIGASATPVIDVYINSQIWRILQYAERYGVLSHLANEARNYRYQLRLFNSNLRAPRLIGLYICDFPSESTVATARDNGTAAIQAGCIATVDASALANLQDALLPPAASSPPSSPESVLDARAE